MIKATTYSTTAILLMGIFSHGANAEEFEQQEVLFLLEEAYTQDKNESQFGLSFDYTDGGEWELEAEFEYGFTERLQFFLEAPIEKEDGDIAQFGDLEFGVDYAILKDRGTGAAPELTIGVGFSAPTGEGDGDWAAEPSLRIAKMVTEGLYLHGLLSAEAQLGGGETEFEEWSTGAGVGWSTEDEMIFTLEYRRDAELGDGPRDVDQFLSGSVAVELENEMTIGAAIAQSIDGDSDTRAILKAQIEW